MKITTFDQLPMYSRFAFVLPPQGSELVVCVKTSFTNAKVLFDTKLRDAEESYFRIPPLQVVCDFGLDPKP